MTAATVGATFLRFEAGDPTLIHIDVEAELELDDVLDFAATLRTSSTLLELDLNKCQLGPEVAEALATALSLNQVLRRLSLEFNSFGSEGGILIARAFLKNRTITAVSLAGNGLGNEGAKAWAQTLEKNNVLTKLDLSHNSGDEVLGDAGACALAGVLTKTNRTLKTLYLDHNEIGSFGGKSLADMLQQNTTLTDLDVGSNKLGDKGVLSILSSMRHQLSLRILCFNNNHFTGDIIDELCALLWRNTALQRLEMEGVDLGKKGGVAILTALKFNQTLKTMRLDVPQCYYEDIDATLKQNAKVADAAEKKEESKASTSSSSSASRSSGGAGSAAS